MPTTTFGVELAQSHLAAELAAQRAIPDAQLVQSVTRWDSNTRQLWTSLGGSDTVIPPQIMEARKKFRVILFLDEYQRQVSGNVRNMLRNILNGRIGNDPIPRGSYVIYASNISDVGSTIEPMNLNQQFDQIEFAAPKRDDFFHYLTGVFAGDGITLKPEVIKAFYQALEDSDISHDDSKSEIRTSPRRWEQLILYVNAAVPVRSLEDASALMANVKANFQDIDQLSSMHGKVERIVREIISLTSGDEFANVKANSSGDWRSTLEHQVRMAEQMGSARKYVPVISGQPGIGKTAMASQIADDLNMRLVAIDCANLTQEEITGIPIPDKQNGKMSVKFSEPALYKRIIQDMKDGDQEFFSDPNVSDEKKQAYRSKKFKYLILFDELNRPRSQSVFNSLRRVVLEKSFTDDVKLPESAIVVAAMNPTDLGTQPLTGHLKDAIDQIDTSPSWPQTQSYLEALGKKLSDQRGSEAVGTAMAIVNEFANHFGIKNIPRDSNITDASKKFYIRIGDSDQIYISPREYTQMFQNLAVGLSRVYKQDASSPEALLDNVIKSSHEKIMMTMKNVLFKQDVNSEMFSHDLTDLLDSMRENLLKLEASTAGLSSMLDQTLTDPTHHLATDLNFKNYMKNEFEVNRFSEELASYIRGLLDEEKTALDAIDVKTHPRKTLQGVRVKIEAEYGDKISFVINEIMMARESFDLSSDVKEAVKTAVEESLSEAISNAPDEKSQEAMEWWINLHDKFQLS
jgi:MoxR-like ATPase